MNTCKSIAWLALAFLCAALGVTALRLPRLLDARLASAQAALDERIRLEASATRRMLADDLLRPADRHLGVIEAQIGAIRGAGLIEAQRAITLADARLGEATAALQAVAKIREDVRPAIAGANLLMARNALPAQVLGTLGAAKITMGQSAQTMKRIEEATPELLAQVDRIGDNVDRATAKSAEASDNASKMFANIEKQTRPPSLLVRLLPDSVKIALEAFRILK